MLSKRRKSKFMDTGLKKVNQQKKFDELKKQLSKEQRTENTFKIKVTNEIDKTYQELKSIKEIVLPKNNEQIRIITNHTPADVFLFKIAETEIINHAIIIIYSMNRKSMAKLESLTTAGRIQKIDFVVSHAWSKLQTADFSYLQNKFKDTNIKVIRTHAKIFLAKTKDKFYVCEGSGNFSRNTNFEQYIFEANKQAFKFHQNWINKI